MPILLPIAPEAHLDQGDVLAGIATCISPTSPRPVQAKMRDFVVVVSRTCNALRDSLIVVAPVVTVNISALREIESPSDLIAAYVKIRNGDGAPDQFYIGEIAPHLKRFAVKFSELYTIEIPTEPQARASFVADHRKYRLDPSFVRDMQLRLFRAFASSGFDDEEWWSRDDLDLVCSECDAALAKAKAEIASLESSIRIAHVSGDPSNKDLKTLKTSLEAAQDRKSKLEQECKSVLGERSRREGNP